MLYACKDRGQTLAPCKGVHTLFSGQSDRERERKREGERMRKRMRKRVRKRGREKKGSIYF